jgi:hypothetical protein
MTIRSPFMPRYGTNQVVNVTSTSQTIDIDPNAKTVYVVNVSTGATAVAHVRIGEGSVPAATAADCPVRANWPIYLQKQLGQNKMSLYAPVGATLHVICGEGGGGV